MKKLGILFLKFCHLDLTQPHFCLQRLIHSFIQSVSQSVSQSVFIYSRNIDLKIYKNEKIVNRNKTDQIRAWNNNNNNDINNNINNNNNDNNNKNNNNYQKDTIKIMLQYCAMHQKVRHALNNHAASAARFSKCFRLLRSIYAIKGWHWSMKMLVG